MPGARVALPTFVKRLTLLLWASSQPACFLLGYEGLGVAPDAGASPSPEQQDASVGPVADGALGDGDAGDLDASSTDAGLSDGGTISQDAATADAGGPLQYGWWDGMAPSKACSGVPGAACSQTCATGQGPCVFECNVIAACTSICEYGTSCHAECGSLASCTHSCTNGADCWFEAKSSSANVSCEFGSTCDVTCPGNIMCNVDCNVGASCILHCNGVACGMNCHGGAKASCPDGSAVCDHPCPTQAGGSGG